MMNQRLARIIIGVEYGLGAVIMAWALYLITAPLHSAADDGSNGMIGVLSGVILLSFSIAIFFAANAMKRGGRKHWLEQFGVIILCLGLFAVIAVSKTLVV